jgi:putative N6-adenine-specific DNA methylase
VLTNPPYGARIGNRKTLFGLYGSLGKVLGERFSGWRVGIVTSDDGLAKAVGLPLNAIGPRGSFGDEGASVAGHRALTIVW